MTIYQSAIDQAVIEWDAGGREDEYQTRQESPSGEAIDVWIRNVNDSADGPAEWRISIYPVVRNTDGSAHTDTGTILHNDDLPTDPA